MILKGIVLLLGVVMLHAQNFTVQGEVHDFHDKTNLKDAKIQLGNYVTTTDSKGHFVLRTIPSGKYHLIVSHPECHPFTETITVNQDLHLSITLEHHSENIETVTVHGTLKKNKNTIVIKTLDRQTLDRQNSENLGNLVSKVSGVSTLKTGNNISKPIIHGVYGSRISVLNNNVKLSEQEWGVEHAPNVDTNAFEHIDIIKGASTLTYGNESIGGLVLLETDVLPKKDTLMGQLKFTGISNGRGGEFAANIAKSWQNEWFVKTGGSFKKLGDLYIPHHTLQNTGAQINAFNFSVGNQNFKNGFELSYSGIQQEFGIFRGAHLESPEDYYRALTFGQPYYLDNFDYNIDHPKQEVNHHILKLSAYKRFSDFGKLSFQYSFQQNHRKEYDIRRGELENLPSMDLRLNTHNASLTHLIERSIWSLESGITGAIQDNYPNPETKARRLIPDYYRYDAGIFSILKYKLHSLWNFEAGVRYDFNRYDAYKYYDEDMWEERFADYYPQFVVSKHDSRILTRPILDYHNFSANVGINYSPSKLFEAKLSLSHNDRAPNAAELFADGLHHSAAVMETGDLTIKKETVYQGNLNLKFNFPTAFPFSLEVNPYILYSDSYINQVPTGIKSTNRGVFQVWDFQQIGARIMGIDTDMNVEITEGLKWGSNFSTLKGDDLTHDEPLILMMPTKWHNALEFNFKRFNNLYISIENENVFQQKRYPIRNQNVTFIDAGTTVSKELDLSTPPKGYTLLHFGLGFDIMKNVNFNFRLNNVFNTEYREYLNRLRYFMPESGRNFTVSVKWQF